MLSLLDALALGDPVYHLDRWRNSSKWLERHMEEICTESTLVYLFIGLDEESLLRVEVEEREKRVVNTWLFLYSYFSSKIHLLPVLNWVPFQDRQSASLLDEMNSEKHLAICAYVNELLIKRPWQCFYWPVPRPTDGILLLFPCSFSSHHWINSRGSEQPLWLPRVQSKEMEKSSKSSLARDWRTQFQLQSWKKIWAVNCLGCQRMPFLSSSLISGCLWRQ